MRSPFLTLFALIPFVVGCYCCPGYYGPGSYGPGFRTGRYNSCVDTQFLAPPPVGGMSGHSRNRPTLAERRQQRELQRWYRELNDEPNGGHAHGERCPHCKRLLRRQSRFSSSEGFYGDSYAYDDGMGMGGFYDGEIVDGGYYDGQVIDGYCPSCQSYGDGLPVYSDEIPYMESPTPVPSPPPIEPTESDSSASMPPPLPALEPTQEFYQTPPSQLDLQLIPSESAIEPASVDQTLFAPPIVR